MQSQNMHQTIMELTTRVQESELREQRAGPTEEETKKALAALSKELAEREDEAPVRPRNRPAPRKPAGPASAPATRLRPRRSWRHRAERGQSSCAARSRRASLATPEAAAQVLEQGAGEASLQPLRPPWPTRAVTP